ncbi:CDP-alcohol phosphatidyltransferase family protein [Stutzerimonas urumqiensis]|uniref:CDP-alcohol phosphatidyltransferase family protein n=1 Tax=Stutzerimonas urumqiensis TaxID=638269 RepID=UPI000EB10641|nr:CDP-alcohol phosphatidyltransferase family protein [Stutzerimonas urumqiensis]
MRHLPNLLTGVRLLLVVPIAWLVIDGAYQPALGLFVIAGLSDALDGFLARRFGWGSSLGAVLDPLADKALLIVIYLCLTVGGWIPAWLATLVLLRDVVIVLGAACYRLVTGSLEMRPSIFGKLSTLLQLALVAGVMADAAFGVLPAALHLVLITVVAVMTAISGLHYVLRWTLAYRSFKACP